ncbi:MAG: hypothetical protein J6P21_03670 [Clostridia bacterium]|nr:hypothetical protein [Clostridia bacterium]
MTIENVMIKFSNLSGISGEALSKWTSICQDSINEISSKLREDIIESEHEEELESAAAALSFYKYVLCTSIQDDLNPENQYISNPYTKNLAISLWQEYKNNISPLLIDSNFLFKEVI